MSAQLVQFNSRSTPVSVAENVQQLDWYSEIEQVAKAANLPMFEDLLCRKTTSVRVSNLSSGLRSVTGTNSFVTLETFVAGVQIQGRDGFDWQIWSVHARAACFAKQYSISREFSPSLVLDFYELVHGELDRKPEDSSEFWHTLTTIDRSRSRMELAEAMSQVSKLESENLDKDAAISNQKIQILSFGQLLGDIPENFAERFGSAANLIDAYEAEAAQRQTLEVQLSECFSELNEKAESIRLLQEQSRQTVTDSEAQKRMESAIAEAEQAKCFLAWIQERRSENKITIEQQEKTIETVRGLNRRLTTAIIEKKAEIRALDGQVESARSLNKKLSSRIRAEKLERQMSEKDLVKTREAKKRILKGLQKARRAKMLAMSGFVLVSSFSISVATYLILS